MYRVIQIREGKPLTVWCTTDSFDLLCGVCQYLIDGAIPDGLKDFWIVWINGEKIKQRAFTEFCEMQEIRKRSFEERMAGNEIYQKAIAAWAEAIRRENDV